MKKTVTTSAALTWVIAAATLAPLFGCRDSGASGTAGGASPEEAATAQSTPDTSVLSRRTTNGETAVRNLNDRIDTLSERVKKPNADLATRTQLFDLLLTRTQFLGTFADFATLHELSEGALRDFPRQGKAQLLHARALSAVHRFGEAEAALARAEALGQDVALARASLRIAEGQEQESVLALIKRHSAAPPTLERLTLQANAEAALGEFEAADEHYRAALEAYRDVSPFPVAYVLFQRGVMWAEMANAPDRASPLYAEAVARLPAYVAANVHLAELEAARGEHAQAIHRLRRLIDLHHTSDPEPTALLAELLLTTNPPAAAEARELNARARASYDQLLSLHHTAFLDHAAEFFTGPGADPALALQLASENLKLRQTPRAHALAIEAALATADVSLACRLITSAGALVGHSQNLRALLDSEAPRCAAR